MTSPSNVTPPTRQTLARDQRLRSPADFRAVFDEGQWSASKAARLILRRRPEGGRRLGISVSRRFGNAVARNRFKRRIREAFRRAQHALPPGIDCVFMPSKYNPDPSYDEILAGIPGMVREAVKRLERRGPAGPRRGRKKRGGRRG